MFAGCQLKRPDDPVRLDRRAWNDEDHQRVRSRRLQPRELRGRRGAAEHVERLLADDQLVGERLAERRLEAVQVVLPVAVVLVEDRDLRVRMVLLDVEPVEPRLGDVVRLPADRPRAVLVDLAELTGAGRDEDVRHLLRVQVGPNRLVDLCAERAHDGEDLVLLDEPPLQLDRVDRVVAVVVVLPHDLPTTDPALLVGTAPGVDVAEVRLHPGRDRRIARCVPGQWKRAADHD